jgi:glycosyltransferase involved in cell wall biosynthesis
VSERAKQIQKKSFSIVIPFRDAQTTLKRCFESLISASREYDPILVEIIFVDNLSSDDSAKLISTWKDEYKDYQIMYLEEKYSKGPGFARNMGIQHSQNDIIIFLDSDDELEKDIFNTINLEWPFIVNGLDLLIFNYTLIDSSQVKNNHRRLENFNLDKKTRLMKFLGMSMDGSIIAMAFRGKWLRELYFRKKLHFPSGYFEDISFLAKALYFSDNIRTVNLDLYLKHYTTSSITGDWNIRKSHEYLIAWKESQDFLLKSLNGDTSYELEICLEGIRGVVGVVVSEMLKSPVSRLDMLTLANKIVSVFPNWREAYDYAKTSKYDQAYVNFVEQYLI